MSRLERMAPATGIVAVVLIVAEFIVTGDTPKAGDPAREVASYWSTNGTTQGIASALFGLAAIAIVWFGATIRGALRSADPRAERLGDVAHAGTTLVAVGLSVFAAFGLAAADTAGDVPTSVTQTFNVLNRDDMFVPLAVGSALLLLATGVAVLRHGGFPRWLGWLSLVLGALAVASVVLGATTDPGLGFLGFLASLFWIVLAAVVMLRRQTGEGATAAGATA